MKHLLLATIAFVALSASAQQRSPHETVSSDDVSVTYGRPYKKGRDVFGGLEKFGSVWRLGADQATTITFKKDAKFGGKSVKAGTYTLFALINEKEWTFILNAELGQWGSFKYNENKGKDVLQVTVPVTKLDHVVEQLTISLTGDKMVVEWDTTQATVSLK